MDVMLAFAIHVINNIIGIGMVLHGIENQQEMISAKLV